MSHEPPPAEQPPSRERRSAVLRTALDARSTRARHRSRGGLPAPPGTGDRALLGVLALGGVALVLLAVA